MVIAVTMCTKDFEEHIKGNKNIVFTYRPCDDGVVVFITATLYDMHYPFDYILICNTNRNVKWEMPTDIINELSIMSKQ